MTRRRRWRRRRRYRFRAQRLGAVASRRRRHHDDAFRREILSRLRTPSNVVHGGASGGRGDRGYRHIVRPRPRWPRHQRCGIANSKQSWRRTCPVDQGCASTAARNPSFSDVPATSEIWIDLNLLI